MHSSLEAKCRAAWQDLFNILPENATRSPYSPHDEFMKTTEGKIHWQIFQLQFELAGAIPCYGKPYAQYLSIEELNMIGDRIQARRFNPRGAVRRYAPGYQNLKLYRQFRSWWIAKELAAHFGEEFDEPCPVEQAQRGPTVSYIEMGHNFEEWTGYKVVPELWEWLESLEAERLARIAADKGAQCTDEVSNNAPILQAA